MLGCNGSSLVNISHDSAAQLIKNSRGGFIICSSVEVCEFKLKGFINNKKLCIVSKKIQNMIFQRK